MSGTNDRRKEMPVHDQDSTAGIQAWVRHDLTQRYDSTLYEPVPAELLALLGAP